MDDKIYPIKATKDNLLLLTVDDEKPELSPGGVDVTKMREQKMPYKKGIVLAKGPGMTVENDNGNVRIPDWLNEGDIVLYHQAAGWDIKFEGKTYTIVSWRQVECMLNPDWVKQNKN